MSTTVDERVVSMRFDNKDFEHRAQNTIGTLDKLKQSLKLTDAAKGFDKVNTASKSIDFSGLSSNLEKVSLKFSALQSVGIGALMTIGNMAVHAGKKLVSALAIDPVMAGLSEYETQLNSVQTILSNTKSKGTTMSDVNTALDELNLYADRTIYNFQEMARNIGTFTAAGIDLDTSVKAIKGIANLAAVSGSNSQQAATAMYQLSQALSTGTVRLMDWNSVVNAGMGGQVFQDAIKETARVHGVAVDDIIAQEGSFRDSLSKGWLTSEILLESLSKFTGDLSKEQLRSMGYTDQQADAIYELGQDANDAATKVKTFTQLMSTLKESAQSGWAQTFEIVIGDFEEAKELWTRVNDSVGGFIGATADWRNKLLTDALGYGWDKLITQGIPDEEKFKESVTTILKQHGIAIDQMIKEEGSLEKALSKGIQNGTITSDMLSQSVFNLQSLMHTMPKEAREAAGYTDETIKQIDALANGLRNGTISMDKFTKAMGKMSGRELIIESLANVFKFLGDILKPIGEAFLEIFAPPTAKGIYSVLEAVHEFTSKLKVSDETAAALKSTFKGLFSIFSILWEVTKAITVISIKFVGALFGLSGGVLEITSKIGDYITSLRDCIKENKLFEGGVGKISDLLTKLGDKFRAFSASIKDKFSGINLDPVVKAFQKAWEVIKLVANTIVDIMASVGHTISEAFEITDVESFMQFLKDAFTTGILAAILKFIVDFDKKMESSGGFIQSVCGVLDGVKGTLEEYQKSLKAPILKEIAKAVLILAAALLIISMIDSDKLMDSLAGMAGVVAALMIATNNFMKLNDQFGGLAKKGLAIMSVATSILILAGALHVIAKAIKIIGDMDPDKAKQGMLGVGVALIGVMGVLASIAVVLKHVPSGSAMTKMGTSLIKLGVAFAVMSVGLIGIAAAMLIMSRVKFENGEQTFVAMMGMVTILATMGLVLKYTPKSKYLLKMAGSMILMSVALNAAAAAFKIMSTMTWEETLRGMAFLVSTMSLMSLAIKYTPKSKYMVKMAGSMILMSVALNAAAAAFKIMSTISWANVGKGAAALGGTLLLFTAALRIIPKSKYILKVAGSMILMSVALNAAAIAFKIISTISWTDVGKGAAALGGTLALFTIAMRFVPKERSVVKFGAAMVLMGATLNLVASAFKIISTIGWSGVWKGLVAFAGVMGALTMSLVILSSGKGSALKSASSIILVAGAIALLAGSLVILSRISLGGILKGLLGVAGVFATLVVSCKLLAPYTKTLMAVAIALGVVAASLVLVGIGLSLASDGVMNFLNVLGSIIQGVLKLIPELVEVILVFFAELITALADHVPVIAEGILRFIKGLLVVIATYIPDIADLIFDIIIKLTEAALKYTPKLIDLIVEGLLMIIEGITKHVPKIVASLMKLIEEIFRSISDAFDKMDIGVILEGTKAIGILTGMMAMLNLAAFLTPGAIIGAIGLAMVLGELVALGALMDKVGGDDFYAALGSLGRAIGSFLGGLAGGFAAEGLEQIGKGLSKFMVAVQPFFEGLKSIPENALLKAALLAAVVTMFGVAEFVTAVGQVFSFGGIMFVDFGYALSDFMTAVKPFFEGLNAVTVMSLLQAGILIGIVTLFAGVDVITALTNILSLGGGLSRFGEELSEFWTSVKPFLDGLALVDPSIIEAAKTLAEMMLIFSAAKLVDGLSKLLGGGFMNNLVTFGLQLIPFGACMAQFAEQVKDVNGEQVKGVADACLVLAKAAGEIPNTGGWIAELTGDNDIALWGQDLRSFGSAIKYFAEETAGIDGDSVKGCADAVLTLAKAASEIPNTGGWIAELTGDNDIQMWGQDLRSFGGAIKNFAAETKDINGQSVAGAAEAILHLTKAANEVPNSGGIAGFFAGENDIDAFGTALESFAGSLVSFSSQMEGASVESVNKASTIMTAIGDTFNNMPSATKVELIKEQLGPFGTAIKNFADNMASVDPVKMATNSAAVKTSASELALLGESCIESFAQAFADTNGKISTAINNMVQVMMFTIQGKKIPINNSLTGVLDSALTTASGYKDDFYTAGNDLVTGFCNGISENAFKAEAQAAAMAAAALEAAKEALGIESPSKEFYKAGGFSVDGFVNAISDRENDSYSAGFSMAEMARSGLSKAISKVKDLVENGIDSQPTIRPVLDLSDVSNGVGTIDDMLKLNPSVGVSAVGSVSSMMNNRIQNGSNDDVIAAIKDLSSRLGNNGDTINVNGVSYNDGSETSNAVKALVRAINVGKRV